MDSDPKRLQQILKNLLSNAVKFTAHGHVDVRVELADAGLEPRPPGAAASAQQVVAFAVEDTGIGIAPEKQRLIFEAFQQADAGTSRKYGGTGLGLAISRELAVLLGGEIKLTSVHGQGSTFTLYLPLHYTGPDSAERPRRAGTAPPAEARASSRVLPVAREEHIADDRNAIEDGDPVLLIIEDDPHYARILLGLARDKGFKGIVATKGAHGAVAGPAVPARRPSRSTSSCPTCSAGRCSTSSSSTRPRATSRCRSSRWRKSASTAWRTAPSPTWSRRRPPTGLEAAFDRIKDFTAPRTKRLLVVEDNDIERQSIVELLGHDDIEMVAVGTGDEALEAMLDQPFDCVVLDLRLPDMTGFELLEKIHAEPALADVPVVVFTGKDLTADEQAQLKTMAKSIVLKDVQSPERLLDETALFLHRVVTDLPPEKQQMLERLHGSKEGTAVRCSRQSAQRGERVSSRFAMPATVSADAPPGGGGRTERRRNTPRRIASANACVRAAPPRCREPRADSVTTRSGSGLRGRCATGAGTRG